MAKEILVKKTDIEKREAALKDARAQIEELLKLNAEYQAKLAILGETQKALLNAEEELTRLNQSLRETMKIRKDQSVELLRLDALCDRQHTDIVKLTEAATADNETIKTLTQERNALTAVETDTKSIRERLRKKTEELNQLHQANRNLHAANQRLADMVRVLKSNVALDKMTQESIPQRSEGTLDRIAEQSQPAQE
jgi:chromosome segregation ATPase